MSRFVDPHRRHWRLTLGLRKDSKTLRLGGGLELPVVGVESQCKAGITEKAGACKVDGIEGANAGQRARSAENLITESNLGDPFVNFW